MKKATYRLLPACPGCRVRVRTGTFSDGDGVWLGDLVSPEDARCPRCGSALGESVETEWPDRCGLCPAEPSVFWLVSDTVYVGLCHPCSRSDRSGPWLDERRRV